MRNDLVFRSVGPGCNPGRHNRSSKQTVATVDDKEDGMPNHELPDKHTIDLARDTLRRTELDVWLAKYVAGHGRRTGSIALGITEEAWRYRITAADRKMLDARRNAA